MLQMLLSVKPLLIQVEISSLSETYLSGYPGGIIFLYLNLSFPGAIRCVQSEGMPTYRSPFEKGNLYVKFNITFPPKHFAEEKHLKVSTVYQS